MRMALYSHRHTQIVKTRHVTFSVRLGWMAKNARAYGSIQFKAKPTGSNSRSLKRTGEEKIPYPEIELTVNTDNGVETYSVLELSHRVYDAALRMTLLDGIPFAKSLIGQKIYAARTEIRLRFI